LEEVLLKLTRIEAGDLDKQQLATLVEFLISRSQTQIVQHGSVIDNVDASARKAKLLVHKFLHSNGLNDYRVLNHEGVLEIVRVKQEESRVDSPEGLKPSMPGPIAGIPRNVKPSDTIEWSSHPWERKSSTRKRD
jgi:hypothetical protein